MPARRELPPPPAEMTERVVEAALAALPRRRGYRLVLLGGAMLAAAIAFGFALAPSGSGLDEPPKAPLKFKAIARGGASGGVLADRAEVTWVAFAHSTWGGANRAAHIFGLGPAAVKAVNRFDYNHHFVVYVFRRGAPVRVRELRLRRLNRSKLELCVYTRDAAGTPPNNYGFEALWVRKTFGINHVVPLLDSSYPVIFDPRGKLVYPVPIGNVKPGLCRSGG
jgi:hypothetical protein